MLSREALDSVAAHFRDNSPLYKKAKAEYEGLREARYNDLIVDTLSNVNTLKTIDTVKMGVIEETYKYIESIVRFGAHRLAKDTFIIDYNLMANLLGKAVYGAIDSVELSFKVNWIVREVVVRLYKNSKRGDFKISNDLRMILNEGKVRNLAKFAELTELDEGIRGSEAHRLLPLFQIGSVLQVKLTRLVKGCLIYLDHLQSGPKTCARAELHTLQYNVKELLATLNFSKKAYIYTKHERDPAYNLILYAMCQKYPSPLLGGVEHVKVPADDDDIILVGYYEPMKHYHNVVVSPQLVMGALIEYSVQFGLGEDLESAMIIACSLRQNRYLEVVGLPTVFSKCDLIYPALRGTEAEGVRQTNSIFSNEVAVMLGRFHQMACLVLFKDIYTSIRHKAERDRFIYTLWGSAYMEDQIGTGLFHMASEMIWLRYLDDEAMARLRNYSVFEGFWLIKNPHNVLKDGVIKCLKQGVYQKYQIRFCGMPNSFDILENEVVLGGGDLDSIRKMSDGCFNVRVCSIVSDDLIKPKRILSFPNKASVSLKFD